MPEDYEITPRHIIGILETPTETKADSKSQVRTLLQVFQDIKTQEVNHKGEWETDKTFDALPLEYLEKLNSILTPDSVDNTVAQNTALNNLGHFVVSYVTDTIKSKKK